MIAFAPGTPAPRLIVGTSDGDVTSYTLGGAIDKDTKDAAGNPLDVPALVQRGLAAELLTHGR